MLWQMEELRAKGVYNAVMHARAYLKTPYMGGEWFRVMDDCVHRAIEIGFYPWPYDEYACPSGTCGSIFPTGCNPPRACSPMGGGTWPRGRTRRPCKAYPIPRAN
jgi:hypothetical protein